MQGEDSPTVQIKYMDQNTKKQKQQCSAQSEGYQHHTTVKILSMSGKIHSGLQSSIYVMIKLPTILLRLSSNHMINTSKSATQVSRYSTANHLNTIYIDPYTPVDRGKNEWNSLLSYDKIHQHTQGKLEVSLRLDSMGNQYKILIQVYKMYFQFILLQIEYLFRFS